ncbi:MAG: KdsC family phosphatase [Quisquiliibacterium sp.]|jgi:3-deoxy-D-manno-octulosonate 8-phosphate phosphatase (KDO 8-P phosphatase)
MLALDVDGTMTDGTIYIGPQSEAMKSFSVRDGLGLALLRQAGLKIAIVTARQSSIVQVRAAELRFDAVRQSAGNKAQALRQLAQEFQLELDQVAYMGDDWNDLPALSIAGLAAAPADATDPVLKAAHWVSRQPAGHGAVRELAEWLLDCQGKLSGLLDAYRQPAR